MLVTFLLSLAVCVRRNHPPETPETPSGPTSGYPDSSYCFVTAALDPDGDSVSIRFRCGPGESLAWGQFQKGRVLCTLTVCPAETGLLEISAQARDEHGSPSNWSGAHVFAIKVPMPRVPKIEGDTRLTTGYQGNYQASCAGENDTIEVQFSWGDGDTSSWLEPQGEPLVCWTTHVWLTPGSFQVQVRARDAQGMTSPWSSGLEVEVAGPRLTWCCWDSSLDCRAMAIAPSGAIVLGGCSIPTGAGFVRALDPGGNLQWHQGIPNRVEQIAISPEGEIYALDCTGVLHTFAADGRPSWEFSAAGSVAIAPDGVLYVPGAYLYALSPDGTELWHQGPGDSAVGAPAVGLDGTIYVSLSENSISALDPIDGSIRWTCPVPAELGTSPAAIGPDGSVYFVACDQASWLYVLTPDGRLEWNCLVDSTGARTEEPVIGPDGMVYVICGGRLSAISPVGHFLWQQSLDAVLQGAVLTQGRTIYVGSSALDSCCLLRVYDLDGCTRASYRYPCRRTSSVLKAPVLSSEGTGYITLDGRLMALEGVTPLPPSGWPCGRHDSRHSGWAGGR